MTRTVTLLRIEGLALLAAGVTVYTVLGGSWWLFALLLFAPDLSMLGYLRGSKMGAAVYNLGRIGGLSLPVAPCSVTNLQSQDR